MVGAYWLKNWPNTPTQRKYQFSPRQLPSTQNETMSLTHPMNGYPRTCGEHIVGVNNMMTTFG